jgi:hypothetical protein
VAPSGKLVRETARTVLHDWLFGCGFPSSLSIVSTTENGNTGGDDMGIKFEETTVEAIVTVHSTGRFVSFDTVIPRHLLDVDLFERPPPVLFATQGFGRASKRATPISSPARVCGDAPAIPYLPPKDDWVPIMQEFVGPVMVIGIMSMVAHESPRATKLYDRTGDEITLDEVERIAI